jgi:hypothetical protein
LIVVQPVAGAHVHGGGRQACGGGGKGGVGGHAHGQHFPAVGGAFGGVKGDRHARLQQTNQKKTWPVCASAIVLKIRKY